MTKFEEFFDGNMFVINLARRPDRMEHFNEEMKLIGVTCVERFEAIDAGPDWGNNGCSASHRAVMDLIVKRGLRRAFVFEDDATVRDPYRGSFNEEVAPIFSECPDDFDMLYLGGHYGSDPRAWFSRHLILMGQMKTTSSYGVTLKSARELRDIIPVGTGDSIDNLYGGYNESKLCLISEPRFFVQYNNYSDLQKRPMNNTPCMEDTGHVSRLGNIGKHGKRPKLADIPTPPPTPPPAPIPPTIPVLPEPPPKPEISWHGGPKKLR
jgi:hypothetical protein